MQSRHGTIGYDSGAAAAEITVSSQRGIEVYAQRNVGFTSTALQHAAVGGRERGSGRICVFPASLLGRKPTACN